MPNISNIPDEMLACQVVEFNKPYKIHKIPVPKDLGPKDILVKIAVASLCHTDSMVQKGIFQPPLPCIASHEGSGTVAAVGSEVTKFRIGDRVMCGIPYKLCGQCPDCKEPEGFQQYCVHMDGHSGVTRDGYFAEYAIADETFSAKLPDAVSFETAAPLACAGCTIWRAVLQAELKTGQWLAIVGSGGGLGHLGIQFAKALKLNVIGIDARDEGLELSKKYGADFVFDARQDKDALVKQVQSVTPGGHGADATISVSDAKTASATACAVTRMHGTMVQIAQPDDVIIPFREFIFRDIHVKSSLISSPAEAESMLETIAKAKITVTTNPFQGLEKIPELIALAGSGKMKGKGIVIVDPEQIEQEKKAGVELV